MSTFVTAASAAILLRLVLTAQFLFYIIHGHLVISLLVINLSVHVLVESEPNMRILNLYYSSIVC